MPYLSVDHNLTVKSTHCATSPSSWPIPVIPVIPAIPAIPVTPAIPAIPAIQYPHTPPHIFSTMCCVTAHSRLKNAGVNVSLPSFHAFRLPVSPSLVFHRRPAVQPTTAYCCPLHLRITPGKSIYILPHTYASTTLKLRQPRVQPELDLALCAVSVFPSVPSPVSRLPSPVFRLPSSVFRPVFRLPSAPVRSRPLPSGSVSRLLPSSVFRPPES